MELNTNSTPDKNSITELIDIECLLSRHYDKKNILNTAKKHKFSDSVLTDIENNGLTYERLVEMQKDVPIYHYLTQITVHGIFDNDLSIYGIGGYKNLIINKNKSLGIRYNAIDYKKKYELSKLIKDISGIGYVRNSNENYFSYVSTDLIKSKTIFDRVNTDLFIGNKSLQRFNFYGTNYYYVTIHINSFPIENLNLIAENLTALTMLEILEFHKQKQIERDIESKRLSEKWAKEEFETESKNKVMLDKLLTTHKPVQFTGQLNFVAFGVNVSDKYQPLKAYKYLGKRGAYHTIKVLRINSIDDKLNFDSYCGVDKWSDKNIDVLIKRLSRLTLITI